MWDAAGTPQAGYLQVVSKKRRGVRHRTPAEAGTMTHAMLSDTGVTSVVDQTAIPISGGSSFKRNN